MKAIEVIKGKLEEHGLRAEVIETGTQPKLLQLSFNYKGRYCEVNVVHFEDKGNIFVIDVICSVEYLALKDQQVYGTVNRLNLDVFGVSLIYMQENKLVLSRHALLANELNAEQFFNHFDFTVQHIYNLVLNLELAERASTSELGNFPYNRYPDLGLN